jgi:hypothetical protein
MLNAFNTAALINIDPMTERIVATVSTFHAISTDKLNLRGHESFRVGRIIADIDATKEVNRSAGGCIIRLCKEMAQTEIVPRFEAGRLKFCIQRGG